MIKHLVFRPSLFLVFGLFLLCRALPANAQPEDPAKPAPVPRSWALETFSPGGTLSELEYGTARSDHAEIAQAVAACYEGFANPVTWTISTRAVLLFELNNNLGHGISQYEPPAEAGSVPRLTSFQRAAISFSDKLSRDRLAFRYDQGWFRNFATGFQVATAVLGGLSTFLIGLRALVDKDYKHVRSLSAAALACSAAGTVVASLGTFGDFQTSQLRASRALAQLQQLHWRVAADVVKAPLVCSKDHESSSDKTNIVNSWRDRYEAIRDAASDTLARPGDLGTATPKTPPNSDPQASSNAPSPAALQANPERPAAALRTVSDPPATRPSSPANPPSHR